MRHPVVEARVKLQRMTQNKCIGINFWKCTINTAPVKPLAQKTHSRLKKIGGGCKELFLPFLQWLFIQYEFSKKAQLLMLSHDAYQLAKGQIKPKADWQAVDSPKNQRTNLFFLLFTANK